jgi:hypothetical protein
LTVRTDHFQQRSALRVLQDDSESGAAQGAPLPLNLGVIRRFRPLGVLQRFDSLRASIAKQGSRLPVDA